MSEGNHGSLAERLGVDRFNPPLAHERGETSVP